MKTNKYILALALTLCCAVGNLHAVDKSYYNSLNGKSGTTLREAMTALVYDKHTTGLGYNWVFDGIDWDSNGNVYDIYSDCGHTKNDATDSYKCCCDAINREHIVPQSTFGSNYPQYADRHHLFVVDGKANGYRSDFAFGECSGGTKGTCKSSSTVKPSEGTATCTNHEYGKLGTSTFSEVSISDKVYEPKDEYKGDIARAIMYMVIRYATADYCKVKSGSGTSANSYPVTAWSGSSNVGLMFSNNLSTNYGLSNYGKALLMKWHRADPVSAKEIARNSGVEAKQGNRNPFIDLPDLAEYLWGTHTSDAVSLNDMTLFISSSDEGSSSPYEITLNRNGATQTITCTGEYTLPTSSTEVAACTGWDFNGWVTAPIAAAGVTTAPTYTTSVNAAATLYAVYGKTTSSAPVRKATMAESSATYTFSDKSWKASPSNWTSGSDGGGYSNNGVQVTTTYSGANATSPTSYSNVSSIVVSYCTNASKGAGSIEMDVNGTKVSQSVSTSGGTTARDLTFDFSSTKPSGKPKITVTCTTNSIYVCGVTINYGSGSPSTTTYKTSPDCGTAHTITLNNGGSATGGDFFADVTSAYLGATVTLTAAPDDGYAFSSWSVTNASTSAAITVTNNQFTMPDANVNVSATFTKNPEHTITFYINDKQVSQQTLSEGLEAEAPNVPACEGYTFVGWYPSSLATTNTTEYDWISNITVGNGDESFYAIYSKTSGGGGGSSKTYNLVLTGSDFAGSYSDRSSTANANEVGGTGTLEVGFTSSGVMKSSNSGNPIQFRKSGSGAGVLYNTTDLGTINSITYGSGSTNNIASTYKGSSVQPTSNGTGGYFKITNGASVSYITSITINFTKTTGSSGTTYYTSATGCDATADCTGKLATPNVTATGSDGKITLSWPAITGATDYEVTIGAGAGYTTECGSATVIGSITGTTTKQCVITGLTNGLAYTTSVKAVGSTTCDSDADEDTTTPVECNPWTDPTVGWGTYSLSTSGTKTATFSVSGTTHGTRSFESSNTNVLTVANNGTVTAKGAGTATVTVHWTAADGYCAKDVISQTFTVSGTLVITYDKNDGSATPATTTQNVTYNVGATLMASNTFTREGYTFLGWGFARDGSKVYDGGQTGVKFTEATTLYAIWQVNSHQVSYVVTPAAGATVQINSSATTPQNANYGSTVTISISPAAHYTLTSVTAMDADNGNVTVSGTGNTRTLVMPDENVTVTVTMTEETKYTVNWYVAGSATAEQNYAGVALAGITDPSIECNGKVFVGWTATANYSNETTAPGDLFSDASTKTMPSNNSTNYYAVFAEETTTSVPSTSEWTRITNISQLSDGATVMLVQYYSDVAINTTLGATSCTANAEITNTNTALRWTAVKSGSKWKFKTSANKYLSTSATSDNTTLALDATYDEWTITADNGGGSGSNNTYTNTNCFRLNNGSDLEYYNSTFKLYAWSLKYSSAYPFYIYIPKMVEGTGYTGYTTSCVAPSTVTVTFNANYGDTPATKTQDVSYNSATALDANTFTREGYSFAGWATTADGSKAYDNQESVTLTKNTTLYALWTKNNYNVTFTPTITGQATITVNGSSTSPQTVEYESTVSIAITPDVAYTVSGVTVTGGVTPSGSGNNWSFTMPAGDVTVTVTLAAKPTYTIRFLNNGNEVSSQTVIQGQMADKPSDPTPCDADYTFEGWWTAALAEDNEESHTWITDFTATQNQDYYAVFSYSEDGGSSSGSKTIDFTTTGWTNESQHTTVTDDPITITVTGGGNNGKYYTSDKTWRMYSGGSISIACASGDITAVASNPSQEFTISNGAATLAFSATVKFKSITVSYGGGSTTYYTTAPVCAACENKITLTKGTPANGSFALDKDNGEYDNCKSKGFVVTVSGITPDEDYEFDAITQTGIADGVTIDQEAKTVTYAQNVKGVSTINVTFRHKPQYTIKFYENGSVISEQLVTINKLPVVPDDPEGCDEYEFVGWWTDELAEDNTATHTWVSSFTATENKNYYAVFRHVESGSGSSSINATFGTDWNSLFGTSYTGTFNPSANSLNLSGSNSGVSIDVTNGTSTNGYIKTSDFRAYNGYTVTITAPVGKNISSITFTKSSKNVADISASVGELTIDGGNGSWEGSSNSVSFSASGTCGFSQIEVTVGGGGTTYYTTDTDCRDCSIPTLSFAATTVNKFDGDAPFINALTVSGNTMGAIVSYTSSNPAKAEVSADGTVTINDAMSTEPVTITATLAKADDGVNCQKKVTAAYTLNIYNKVTWLVNGSEYTTGTPTVQTTEGGTIDIAPTNPDGSTMCFGKTFVGWTTAEYDEDDTKPETLYTSSSIVGLHITQKTTFYAVFAELAGTLNEYRKGTPSQLTTGQKVIIVNTAANKAMKAVSSFKAGYDVTPVGDAFVTEEQPIIWTVEQADGGGFYFTYDNKYLNSTGSSLYLDGDEDAWTVTGAGPYVITSGKYPTYSLEWYSNEFKSFSTGSGDAFNMDLYFPNWTIRAYSTNCGLCLPKPEVQSVIVKQDRATVTWKSVAYATGYEFTCSGGEVAISGTTATITGLTPLSDYTYSLRAQGGDPYTCFRTTNGSFSTPDCDDMPYDITATPYNVVQAIIRWKAESERGKVIVYNDEACTSVFTTVADTLSPCYVSGLAENTRYWFKVFGGASQDCASPVQTFLTQTTAVEIVEWQNDGVIILLTGDEMTASVLIEDKEEHVEHVSNVADKLFISKYFEADGNNKMIAVYNGTPETIDITNYWLKHSNKGSAETKICLKKFGKTPGQIAPNEEIIIMRFTSSTDPATECAEKEENYDEWNIVEDKEMDGEGNNIYNWLANIAGPQSVGLYNGTTMIDLIGARTESGALVQIESSIKQPCAAAIGSNNDAAGFSAKGLERGTEDSIMLSTNRCLLIRKNTVKSGDNAVATNIYTAQEECGSEITKAFKTLSDEWVGYVIGKDNASTRTCEGLAEVGGFDYQGYYASFDSVTVLENLVKNPDGTITIPIEGLDTMSCTMLRINVYDKTTQEQKASREYRIPIMIQSGEVKSTNELFTKHGVAVCKECDVLVFNGATLKKDNEGTDRDSIGNLTLYPGSTLELPAGKGDYHVKSLTYRVEGDNVPATKLNGDLYSETQQLIVTRRIKNDRYYFISFPYDVNVNEITLANGSKAVNGKDFRLLEYDAETRAQEGSLQGVPGHWKMLSGDKLHAGRGYAIAVNTKAMKEIMFHMTIPSKNLTNEERTKVTNTVDINEYVGAARNTNHNWNLIAHPYITKFEVSGAESVEAYWESPSRENTDWIDDWQTWEDPTQPTDTTHTQNPDSTETHIGDILESGTVDNGLVWVLYANATMELTGGGQMVDFSSLEAVPWAQHRQFIKDLKIGGDVQKIGKYAFSQCTNLVTVTIAAPVTNLASYAFAGCTQLRSFRIESTQYISATTTTFDGVSTLSVYVPQSMYDQYLQNSPWNKMALSAFDGSSTTGGDGSNTNPTPRRAVEHPDGWTESPGGIYVTRPTVTDGKITYEQLWINAVEDIPPFTAMFIQGDGRGEMTFNMYPASPAPKRNARASRYETKDHTVFVGVSLHSTNGMSDLTSLRLRPDFGEHYKFGQDLLKFTVFNTSRPQLYIKTPDDQLAFRAISDSLAEHTWIPVGVYCRDAGEYTFSLYDKYVLDEIEAVYLHDNVTGITTNLLYGNYKIETTKQLYTNTRFTLNVILRRKVEVDTPTVIEHTENPNAPRKFFRDGVMYIMRDGKIYDLTGKPAELDKLLLNR